MKKLLSILALAMVATTFTPTAEAQIEGYATYTYRVFVDGDAPIGEILDQLNQGHQLCPFNARDWARCIIGTYDAAGNSYSHRWVMVPGVTPSGDSAWVFSLGDGGSPSTDYVFRDHHYYLTSDGREYANQNEGLPVPAACGDDFGACSIVLHDTFGHVTGVAVGGYTGASTGTGSFGDMCAFCVNDGLNSLTEPCGFGTLNPDCNISYDIYDQDYNSPQLDPIWD